jgi:hypothetical protein
MNKLFLETNFNFIILFSFDTVLTYLMTDLLMEFHYSKHYQALLYHDISVLTFKEFKRAQCSANILHLNVRNNLSEVNQRGDHL